MGGSANITSYCAVADGMYLSASPRIRRRLSVALSCWATLRMKLYCVAAFSTEVTVLHPRDRNSNVIAPVPANRSNASASSKSTMFSITLNIFSRAKSVVGLADMFVGTSKRRRPYFPRIIRIVGVL